MFSDTMDNHQSGDLAAVNNEVINIAGGGIEGTGSIETWTGSAWRVAGSHLKLERLVDFTTATINKRVFIFGGNIVTPILPQFTDEVLMLSGNNLEVLDHAWPRRFSHRTITKGNTSLKRFKRFHVTKGEIRFLFLFFCINFRISIFL